MVIFGSLIPVTTAMTSKIAQKKVEAKVMEVAYQGAILYRSYGTTSGELQFDDIVFEWVTSEASICVTKKDESRAKSTCVTI